ncbi:hypothetical protein ACFL3S_07330 [Gemmatimonadota bacterium]
MSEYGSLPWSDKDVFRDLLARAWIWEPDEMDWDSFKLERKALGDLLELLGPIAALQQYGTAEDFESRSEAVNEALAFAPMPWARGEAYQEAKGIQDAVSAFALRLAWFAGRMKEAGEFLKKKGWKYDPGSKKVKRDNVSSRPALFRGRVNVALAEALRGGKLVQDAALYEEVAKKKRWWFPPEECKPKDVETDVKNRLGKLRRAAKAQSQRRKR